MIPGLHINTVAELLYYFGMSGFWGAFLLYILYGIATALDSIYSVALNIPDGATGIAPTAAQMLSAKGMVGRGVYSYIMGGVIGIGVSLVSLPILYTILPILQPFFQENMLPILLFASSLVLLNDFNVQNLAVFLIAGIFGMFVLNSGASDNLIFPMFVGFFTLPMLMTKTVVLEVEEGYSKRIGWAAPIIASIVTAIAYMIPGVATPTMIIVFAGLFANIRDDEFVSALGAINTANIIFSIMMIDFIGKARTGVAIVVQNMYHTTMFWDFMLALAGASAFGIAALIILHSLPRAVNFFAPFTHPFMKLLLAVYLVLLTFLVSGAFGVLVMGVACAIGIFTLVAKARRANLMGSIIVNAVMYYFGRK